MSTGQSWLSEPWVSYPGQGLMQLTFHGEAWTSQEEAVTFEKWLRSDGFAAFRAAQGAAPDPDPIADLTDRMLEL